MGPIVIAGLQFAVLVLLVIGGFYAKTPITQGAVLGSLTLLYFGIHLYRDSELCDCSVLSQLLCSLFSVNPTILPNHALLQIVLGTVLLLMLAKTLLSVLPLEHLF
jgi:hypothetical protein